MIILVKFLEPSDYLRGVCSYIFTENKHNFSTLTIFTKHYFKVELYILLYWSIS